jgi:PAS domain S-box-containing protein
LVVTAAVIANLLMTNFLHASPTLFSFLCAIIFAAWFGGAGPGLAATALSILAFDYFFLPPIYSIDLLAPDMPRIALFATVSVIVIGLIAEQRNTAESLRRSRADLEEKVQDLEKLNAALQIESAERQRAEQKSRAMERDLQVTIDTIPISVASFFPDGSRDFVNRPLSDYTGISRENARAATWPVTVHPDDVDAGEAEWRACLTSGKIFQMDLRIRRADGEYRWNMARLVPLRDDEGNIIKWYGIAFDIEDQKRAEGALRESEARLIEATQELQQTIDMIPAKITVYPPDGTTRLTSNLTWCNYTGLSLGDKAAARSWAVAHPDDVKAVEAEWAACLARHEPFQAEVRLRRHDGVYRWHMGHRVPLRDQKGDVINWYAFAFDIEDQKRAEDALRQSEAYLAEAQRLSHTGSFGWNVTSGTITWSAESYRIFEYDTATKATIEMVLNRVHPDDVALVGIVIEHATINKESFDFEHRLLMPDGSVKHLNVVAHPSINNSGELQFVGAVMDITARKLADDALRQSEAYLAEALGIANIGYWERDTAADLINWSEQTLRIFGLSPGEGPMTFARLRELVHPDDRPVIIAAHAEAETLRSGERYDSEFRAVRPNGEVRFLHSRGNVTRDESGRVRRMFGIVEDLTERKLAEAALVERAALLDLSHDSIFVRGMNDAISFWNRGAEQLYGWSKDQALGQISHQLLRTIFPAPLEEITSELLRTGRWEGELVHTKRDGTQVTVASRWSLRHDERGGPAGILETNNDITERKRAEESLRNSEQRYRNLFHHMPIALWQLNASNVVELFKDLRAKGVSELGPYIDEHPDFPAHAMEGVQIEEVNERMIEMLGGRDATDILGSLSRFGHIHLDAFTRGLENRFRGETMHQTETKIMTLDGRVVDVHLAATRPSLDPALTLVGLVDITERVRAQEMVQRVQADFAHAARVSMLGELTASIAHEVNQPLAAIVTNSEVGLRLLNRSKPDPAELREIVTCVVNDARRATDIIARVRTMATRQAPEQTLLSVDEVIREALLFLRHEVQSHGLAVTHHVDPAAPKVLGDRTQLQQVFVNLTVNAIQAMTQAESAQRMLVIRTAPAGPDTLSCTIEDSGPGINPDHLDRLFDSFFTTKGSGMGMGLAISRSIIEAHRGNIRADNESAFGGARFRFTLPAKAH